MRLFTGVNAFFLVPATVLVLLSACTSDKVVTFKSGGMTQTFSEGAASDMQSFPLPVYPNAKPTGEVQATGESNDSSRFLMLASTDKVSQIASFYHEKLKTDGWAVSEKFSEPQLVNLSATRKDLDASVMISQDADGKTTINLAVSKQVEGTPKPSGQVFVPDTLNPPTD